MTTIRLIAASLFLPMILGEQARGQVPPGHFLVTENTALAPDAGGLFLYEPLQAMVWPLDTSLLGGRQPHKAIIGGTAATLIAALPDGFGDEIVAMTVQGRRIIAVRSLTDVATRTIALERLPGGPILVATRRQIFLLGTALNSLTPLLIPRAADEVFVDLTHMGNRAVALTRLAGGSSQILVFEPGVLGDAPHLIDVPQASAISYDPTQHAFLVGNEFGEVFLIDAARFVGQRTGVIPASPISSITFNQDQLHHLIGSFAKLTIWDNGPQLAVPAQRGIEVTDLDYRPYRASFTSYGSGCSQSNFKPFIGTVGRAFPGSNFFAVTISGAPPDSLAILLLGRASTRLPLDVIGMSGCTLLVARIIRSETCQVGANGLGALPLSIPPIPSLAGFQLFMQWAVVDRDANALGFSTSEGGHSIF